MTVFCEEGDLKPILKFEVVTDQRREMPPATVELRASRALTSTIRSGQLVDTKFYLYSRKCGANGAREPKELYVSSAILHQFNDDLDDLCEFIPLRNYVNVHSLYEQQSKPRGSRAQK